MPFSDASAISDYLQRFNQAATADPVVAKAALLIRSGELSESEALRVCVVHLVEQKKHLQDQLQHAQSIMPRRVKMHDGKIYRWDAPDEFVPVND